MTSSSKSKRVRHRNYTVIDGVRHYWYCGMRHNHAVYPVLRYKCLEKGCKCFSCGWGKK